MWVVDAAGRMHQAAGHDQRHPDTGLVDRPFGARFAEGRFHQRPELPVVANDDDHRAALFKLGNMAVAVCVYRGFDDAVAVEPGEAQSFENLADVGIHAGEHCVRNKPLVGQRDRRSGFCLALQLVRVGGPAGRLLERSVLDAVSERQHARTLLRSPPVDSRVALDRSLVLTHRHRIHVAGIRRLVLWQRVGYSRRGARRNRNSVLEKSRSAGAGCWHCLADVKQASRIETGLAVICSGAGAVSLVTRAAIAGLIETADVWANFCARVPVARCLVDGAGTRARVAVKIIPAEHGR